MKVDKPLVLAAVLVLSAACSKLTEPPRQEPIQSETTSAKAEPALDDPARDPHAGHGHGKDDPAPDPHAGHGHGKDEPHAEAPKPADPDAKLEIKDLVVGKGAEAKKGDAVTVHYVGTLPDGKEFDASKKHGKPFDFQLGAGRVIKGWDEGVAGMKVGGKRKLTVPPSLGYGARGFPPVIPPNSTLIFEVELLEVKPQ
jgi:FKBP-type peptidyl-prolyl cis-trans isomerase